MVPLAARRRSRRPGIRSHPAPPGPAASPSADYVNENPSNWVAWGDVYTQKMSGAACDLATVTGSISGASDCCEKCAALNLPQLSHITFDTGNNLCKCQKPFLETCLTEASTSSIRSKFCYDKTGKLFYIKDSA